MDYDTLLKENQLLVKKNINYARRYGLSYDDLYSFALTSLWTANNKYDGKGNWTNFYFTIFLNDVKMYVNREKQHKHYQYDAYNLPHVKIKIRIPKPIARTIENKPDTSNLSEYAKNLIDLLWSGLDMNEVGNKMGLSGACISKYVQKALNK